MTGFLKRVRAAGVTNLTVMLPSLIDLIRSADLDFKIKASAICSIDNANKALFYKKMGVDKIVVKELINRDFHTLKRIRNSFGEKIELIVNSPCHMDCPSRMSHYNQQSYDSIEYTNDMSFNYYEHTCMLRRYEDFASWLKIIWIRPEDIKYYEEIGINYFKIQGRQLITKGGDPVKVAEAYFEEKYDGDLVDLINLFSPVNSFKVNLDNRKLDGFIKPFYEIENFCVRDCTVCDYCEKFAGKCLDLDNLNDVSELAVKFYKEYDEFYKTVKGQSKLETSIVDNTFNDVDDDFEL